MSKIYDVPKSEFFIEKKKKFLYENQQVLMEKFQNIFIKVWI